MQWISAVLSNEEEKNLRLNFKAEKRDNMESVLQNLLGTVRNNEKKGQDRFIALEDTLNLRISTLENKHNLRISKLELDVAFLKDSSYDTTNAYISSSISKLLLDDRLVNYANTFFTYTPTTDSPDIIVGEIFLLARAKHVELDLITLLFEYNPKWVAHFTSAKIFSQHFKNLKQKCNGGSHYLASEHELRRMTSEFESNLLQDGLRIWADFALECTNLMTLH
ncbi:MAG: hypothetical protein Sylvanvirus24_6 [Sylvanvirus sp.]|uniref:Uncharacterized protein n=1 Tax=Sylvanvirus sp. TaxID=2487774 RepID=A0A3G5AK68_9VIRU|nr:MAG: hypothetical protein Sylvanvirus24_6 [Sylvanvirus sp.]